MVGDVDLAPRVVVDHLLLGFGLTFPRAQPVGWLVAYPPDLPRKYTCLSHDGWRHTAAALQWRKLASFSGPLRAIAPANYRTG